MCICMCPILKLILGVTCGVSKESEEEEGGRGGSESVSLQEDNSNCSQNEEMYILYFYTETIMISSESIHENSTLQIKGQTNSAI